MARWLGRCASGRAHAPTAHSSQRESTLQRPCWLGKRASSQAGAPTAPHLAERIHATAAIPSREVRLGPSRYVCHLLLPLGER
eukprot:6194513-Alexandrium_andersonii.AAC.1